MAKNYEAICESLRLAGEQKLAYCLASRWTNLRDNGLIGAIAQYDPK